MNKNIIAIDPSGNFSNGKGGTGIAAYIDGKTTSITIWAKDYGSKEEYYQAIINAAINNPKFVVIEDFKLQSGARANAQSNQSMETSELIGRIEAELDRNNIRHRRQQNVVKHRWKNNELFEEEMIEAVGEMPKGMSRHERDAWSHFLTAWFFNWDKEFGNE